MGLGPDFKSLDCNVWKHGLEIILHVEYAQSIFTKILSNCEARISNLIFVVWHIVQQWSDGQRSSTMFHLENSMAIEASSYGTRL